MSVPPAARFLILFLLGGLAGWRFLPSSLDGQTEPLAAASARPAAPEGAPRRELPRSAQDLQRWAQELAARFDPLTGYGDPDYARELADWSQGELRAALEQGLADPGVSREGGPVHAALLALLGEWTKRDPDAAWAWLSGLPQGPTRVSLCEAIAAHWPQDRIEECLDGVMANVEDFHVGDGKRYHRLLQLSAESAAMRGPLALDELVSRTRESGMEFPDTGLNFPPGFDFAGFVRAPFMAGQLSQKGGYPGFEMEKALRFVAEGWLRADVGAAVPGLLALEHDNKRDTGTYLFQGLAWAGVDQARQAGAALGKLPLEEQRELFTGYGMSRFHAEPEARRALIDALPDAGMRSTANLAVAGQLLRAHRLIQALPFVSAGSDPTERIAILESQLEEVAKVRSEGWELAPADSEEVRKTLVSWQADEERIGRILGKLK